MKTVIKLLICALSLPVAAFSPQAAAGSHNSPHQLYGPQLRGLPQAGEAPPRFKAAGAADPAARLLYWNEQVLRANVLDHTTPPGPSRRVFGEQIGPGRTSRAFAIIHIAVFDALSAITGRYPTYTGIGPAPAGSSLDAAIAKAAHDTLVAMYPSQEDSFHELYRQDLRRIADGRAKNNGVEAGRRAAAAILALRAGDPVDYAEPTVYVDFFPSNAPGKWRPDPVSLAPVALGAYWGYVKPFVLPSAAAFRPAPPPALTSSAYTAAFNEVRQLGGDGAATPTRRTPHQTIVGTYWAYDGTPGLGTPPRMYNQIAAEIAAKQGADAVELARILALVNVAMADTAMVVWDVKYDYQFWRPVTAIREASPGASPTGLGDGNPDTRGDPDWTPLGSPASNLAAPNFTPPFPAYPSGHAGLGSALFQTLRNVYASDQIAFTFVSDELNGVTRDNQGVVRPRLPRRFASLSQAEEENGQSRIYLGIHWAFDKTGGFDVGRKVADYIFQHGLVPPGG